MPWRIRKHYEKIVVTENRTVEPNLSAPLKMVLAYPNTYQTGIASLGYQTAYRLFNELDDVCCERAFLPDKTVRAVLDETGNELCSLETVTPLSTFALIAFSISFEMDFLNVIDMLELAGIPLYARDRTEEHPLILVGGPISFLNPEPIADFTDIFLVGDGEELIPDFMRAFHADYDRGLPRDELLEQLSTVDGAYVPAFYDIDYAPDGTIAAIRPNRDVPARIKKRFVRQITPYANRTVIATPESVFGNTFLVEMNRGCPYTCRFCAVGYTYRPVSFRDKSDIERLVSENELATEKVGLVGCAIADHPDLEAISRDIANNNLELGLASLRADNLTEDMIHALREGNVRTITIAPETGSDRMRRVINKAIRNNDLFEAARSAGRAGVEVIKLYYMIGLPWEDASDIEAIVDLTLKIQAIHQEYLQKPRRFLPSGRNVKSPGRSQITVSLNPLVPKAWTPFQWCANEHPNSIKKKLDQLNRAFRKNRGVKVQFYSQREAIVQSLLSRGDRRVSAILAEKLHSGDNWKSVFKRLNVDLDFYLFRERDPEELFPWEIIEIKYKRHYLWKHYERARAAAAEK